MVSLDNLDAASRHRLVDVLDGVFEDAS